MIIYKNVTFQKPIHGLDETNVDSSLFPMHIVIVCLDHLNV